jgi:Macrocin-O-methyltransferase (TylF)
MTEGSADRAAATGTKLGVRASPEQLSNREELKRLFAETPLPPDDLLVNLPLYMRSSTVAKLLWVNELYEAIVPIPGVIMEFGVWWGANLTLFESLRAVHEPYNYSRRVIGFDTFEGYPEARPEDGDDPLVHRGAYAVGEGHPEHLERLLEYHERENPMSHIRKHETVVGDASETIGPYLSEHSETMIALAYFDMQLYEPTKACLEAIRPYLVRGSVLAMDELNAPEFPGETVAFREVLGLDRYAMHRSRFLPDRTYVVVE